MIHSLFSPLKSHDNIIKSLLLLFMLLFSTLTNNQSSVCGSRFIFGKDLQIMLCVNEIPHGDFIRPYLMSSGENDSFHNRLKSV